MKHWFAEKLRRYADRIDYSGAPKLVSEWTFTFEKYRGLVWRRDGRGIRVWYIDPDTQKAWDEADTDWARVWPELKEAYGR